MQFDQLEEKAIQKKLVASSLIADRYEIIQKIGEGAMGVVYKAKHVELGRIHAVKVLHSKISDDPNSRERFKREGKIAASLNHPNVAAIYDCGEMSDGFPFLVMDFIEGKSLDEMIKRFGCLSADVALPLFIQICKGLAHAHNKNIVHRDLKPGNIMIVSEGRTNTAKITDFGIAKSATADSEGALTKTGEVFGSVLYMSPEQCSGQALDGRTDIYSLGCLMYETLSGKAPLRGENAVQTIYKHMNERPKSFLEIGAPVPKDLEDIILKALEKDPDRRFQSAEQMAAALENLIDGPPQPKQAAATVNSVDSQDQTVADPAQDTYEKTTISGTTPKRGSLIALIVALLIAVVGISVFISQSKVSEPAAMTTTTGTPSTTTAEPPATIAATQVSANQQPWIYSETKDGLQVRVNPLTAGQPEMIVIYAHQAADQGRSEDNDYLHMGHITVNVPERRTNSVLVLSGFSPKVWNLNIAKGTKIEKIILTGLHKQTVKGVPTGVKVIASSDRSEPVGSTPKDYYESLGPGEVPFPNYTLSLSGQENILENSNFKDMRDTLKKVGGRDVSSVIYADSAPMEIDL